MTCASGTQKTKQEPRSQGSSPQALFRPSSCSAGSPVFHGPASQACRVQAPRSHAPPRSHVPPTAPRQRPRKAEGCVPLPPREPRRAPRRKPSPTSPEAARACWRVSSRLGQRGGRWRRNTRGFLGSVLRGPRHVRDTGAAKEPEPQAHSVLGTGDRPATRSHSVAGWESHWGGHFGQAADTVWGRARRLDGPGGRQVVGGSWEGRNASAAMGESHPWDQCPPSRSAARKEGSGRRGPSLRSAVSGQVKARAGRNAGQGACSTAPASPQDQDGETSHVRVTTQAPGTVGDTLASISYNSMNDRAVRVRKRPGRPRWQWGGAGGQGSGRGREAPGAPAGVEPGRGEHGMRDGAETRDLGSPATPQKCSPTSSAHARHGDTCHLRANKGSSHRATPDAGRHGRKHTAGPPRTAVSPATSRSEPPHAAPGTAPSPRHAGKEQAQEATRGVSASV